MRPHGTPEQLETRRQLAARLLPQGYGVSEIARMVGVRPSSVTRWKQALEKRGPEGLRAIPHPGPAKKLSDPQRKRLLRLLLKKPSAHGFPTELWTLARVAQVIEKHFGVHYDPSHVYRILKALGWSSQKPERRARERDEEAIERWRTHDWPRIKKRPKKTTQHCSA